MILTPVGLCIYFDCLFKGLLHKDLVMNKKVSDIWVGNLPLLYLVILALRNISFLNEKELFHTKKTQISL